MTSVNFNQSELIDPKCQSVRLLEVHQPLYSSWKQCDETNSANIPNRKFIGLPSWGLMLLLNANYSRVQISLGKTCDSQQGQP